MNTYYTVKHTAFTNYAEAAQYCKDNDFDPELMLITEKEQTTLIYWYEYRLRGFSPGCQPKGHIDYNPNIGRHGIIAYDRLLTDSELDDYELKLYTATIKTA